MVMHFRAHSPPPRHPLAWRIRKRQEAPPRQATTAACSFILPQRAPRAHRYVPRLARAIWRGLTRAQRVLCPETVGRGNLDFGRCDEPGITSHRLVRNVLRRLERRALA